MTNPGLEKAQKVFRYVMAVIVFLWIILENFVVFSRYIAKMSFPWSDEVFTMTFIWLIFIGCALAAVDNKHIEISVLTDALHGRSKMILKVVQNLFMLIFIAVLLVQSISICRRQAMINQTTAILRIQVWYTTAAMVVGSAAWLVVTIWKIAVYIKAAMEGKEVRFGIAQSAHKFSNDIRLLQHMKEVEEPFEKHQIGSSAMAYKRNPMRSERMASLANYVMSDAMNPAITAATQWFERTLDDSANKRISVSEAFLATDGILELYMNVSKGLVVYPKVIEAHLMAELPFMATENIMMDAVKAGGDRQELHERIRVHSMAAGKVVKEEGKPNDLLDRIATDPAFNVTREDLDKVMKPENYVGRAPEQTAEYLRDVIKPILNDNRDLLGAEAEINV